MFHPLSIINLFFGNSSLPFILTQIIRFHPRNCPFAAIHGEKKLRDSSVASLLQNDITKTVCCHSERSEESNGFVISPRIAGPSGLTDRINTLTQFHAEFIYS